MIRVKLFFFLIALLTISLNSYGENIQNISLQDSKGEVISLSKLKSDFYIISFFYTYCTMPKMCPLTVAHHKKLKQLNVNNKYMQVLVTLDPVNDDANELTNFAKKNNLSDIVLLTGKKNNLFQLYESVGLLTRPGENGEIIHQAMTVVFDKNFKLIKKYKDNDWTPNKLVSELN